MPQAYTSCLIHCVFSTKHRRPTIIPEIRERLWAYMGGILRAMNALPHAVGGTSNHAHLLLSLPAALPLSTVMRVVKGRSSRWIHDLFPSARQFAWQEGYGAFSIGASRLQETIAYIQNQEAHHRVRTYQEEFLKLLAQHGIEPDYRYIWK
jgi:REP element-mobilizing transposase RayT